VPFFSGRKVGKQGFVGRMTAPARAQAAHGGLSRGSLRLGVPAALSPVGVSVSHPKERPDGHAI
jgi:hypothetical protein